VALPRRGQLLRLLRSPGQARGMDVSWRAGGAPGASVKRDYAAGGTDSIAAAQAGFRRRRGAIHRKRLMGRLRSTGQVVGWVSGLGVVAAIVTFELASLR
jgi:hypothetical protein